MSAALSLPGGERRVFAARMTALPATATFIDAFCARNGLASADALRLTLVVEELFTNSVVHGYGGDSDAPIEVSLAAAPARSRCSTKTRRLRTIRSRAPRRPRTTWRERSSRALRAGSASTSSGSTSRARAMRAKRGAIASGSGWFANAGRITREAVLHDRCPTRARR